MRGTRYTSLNPAIEIGAAGIVAGRLMHPSVRSRSLHSTWQMAKGIQASPLPDFAKRTVKVKSTLDARVPAAHDCGAAGRTPFQAGTRNPCSDAQTAASTRE